MTMGEVIAAQILYNRAYGRGESAAAYRIARTYDAKVYYDLNVRGLKPSAAKALEWHRKAQTAGVAEVASDIAALETFIASGAEQPIDDNVPEPEVKVVGLEPTAAPETAGEGSETRRHRSAGGEGRRRGSAHRFDDGALRDCNAQAGARKKTMLLCQEWLLLSAVFGLPFNLRKMDKARKKGTHIPVLLRLLVQ